MATRRRSSKQTPRSNPIELEAERLLAAFRETTGLLVCFKLLRTDLPATGLEAVTERHGLHLSDFCTGVKRTQNERCKQCDLRDVPARCALDRKIFSHVCHAGAGETIVPLFVDEALAAVVYIGQFRTDDNQPLELKKLETSDVVRIEALGRLLQSYLSERLRTARYVSESSQGYRAEEIKRFLEKNLSNNPSLTDLAKHLGLSTTRTAHAVKEATGSSFVELRDALRLERARALLQGTYHKIGRVATECGFSSTQYFHRCFRRRTKTTPLAFRRRHRAEA